MHVPCSGPHPRPAKAQVRGGTIRADDPFKPRGRHILNDIVTYAKGVC